MFYKVKDLKPFGVIISAIHGDTDIFKVPIDKLKSIFCRYQLIVLRGFKSFKGSESLVDYCQQWGKVSVWPFGKVLELVEHEKPEDHIFDNSYVPLHWDGMYREQVPEYQIFHCLKAPLKGKGGKTNFSHTRLVLENSDEEVKRKWSKIRGVYEREMEFYNSRTSSPIISKHPFSKHLVIRYNEPPLKSEKFINPPNLKFLGSEFDDLEDFHKSIREALYDKQNCYSHEWESGDVVIADNFNLLHGREKFESQSPRHIRRVQVLSELPFDNPGLESYK